MCGKTLTSGESGRRVYGVLCTGFATSYKAEIISKCEGKRNNLSTISSCHLSHSSLSLSLACLCSPWSFLHLALISPLFLLLFFWMTSVSSKLTLFHYPDSLISSSPSSLPHPSISSTHSQMNYIMDFVVMCYSY